MDEGGAVITRGSKMERIWRAGHRFFWKTLCPRPDMRPGWLVGPWYSITGRIAHWFHCRLCERCRERREVER